MKIKLLLFAALFCLLYKSVQPISISNPIASNNQCSFIENVGQWDDNVLFLARLQGLNVWITKDGMIYDYFSVYNNVTDRGYSVMEKGDSIMIKGHVVSVTFVSANSNVNKISFSKNSTYYNYFIENDRSKWRSYVSLYDEVVVENVYDGVAVRYYFDKGSLRYDFQFKPNVDASIVKIAVDGAEDVRLSDDGELIIGTVFGDVVHGDFYAYQNIMGNVNRVDCKFKNDNGVFGLKLGDYESGR